MACRHFNEWLFASALPEVAFTLHRHNGARGYASMDRFIERGGDAKLHELAINPDLLLERTDKDTLSTLVHEMAHVWQFCFGEPGRGRYHNREWADRMEALGLIPSDTGAPGGRRTGDRVSHYIVPGGPFDRAADELLGSGWMVRRGSRKRGGKGRVDPSKTRFTCPSCGQHAWAKRRAELICGTCHAEMAADATLLTMAA